MPFETNRPNVNEDVVYQPQRKRVYDKRWVLQFGLAALTGTQIVTWPRKGWASPQEVLADPAFQGAGIAYLEGGQIAKSESFGAIETGGDRITAQTLFQAASISKTVNALAILSLSDRGEIDLDRPINDQLRNWKLPGRYADRVTPAMLLSHTAGANVPGFEGYAHDAQTPTLIEILNGSGRTNSAPAIAAMEPGIFPILRWWDHCIAGSAGGCDWQRLRNLCAARDSSPPLDELLYDGGRWNRMFQNMRGGMTVMPTGSQGDIGYTLNVLQQGLWTTPSDLCRMGNAILHAVAGAPGGVLLPQTAARMIQPVFRIEWPWPIHSS